MRGLALFNLVIGSKPAGATLARLILVASTFKRYIRRYGQELLDLGARRDGAKPKDRSALTQKSTMFASGSLRFGSKNQNPLMRRVPSSRHLRDLVKPAHVRMVLTALRS